MLTACASPLAQSYDVAVLDLDGVVYIGGHAVQHAPEALADATGQGMTLAYVTNNAARTPATVATHLRDLGIDANAEDVVTSAQAAARMVARQVPPGAHVYVIGGEGLEEALREQQLMPVTTRTDHVVAVAQGFGPDMPWRQVITGAILVREGLPWVASNTDLSVPTPDGPGPGNGTLVGLVADFSGRTPEVAGKPEAPLFEETLMRVRGSRPLVVGDRLDTDIQGARGLGWDSLLVMTGVTGLRELAECPPELRPTYVAADLRGLSEPHPAPEPADAGWACGGWTAEVVDGHLHLRGAGEHDDWWRAVAAAAWDHLDASGAPVGVGDVAPPR